MIAILAIFGVSTLFLIGVGSFIVASAALGFSIYNYIQQRRKSNLRNLAGELQSVLDWSGLFRTAYIDPFENEDLYFALKDLGRDILAYHHLEGKSPQVELVGFTSGYGDSERSLDSPEEVLDEVKNGELLRLVLAIDYDGGELDLTSYWIGDIYRLAKYTLPKLGHIEDGYLGLIEQFDPEIIEDNREVIERLILKSANHTLEVRSRIEVDPSDYKSSSEMAQAVYRQFLYYDGIEEDLDELNTLLTRLDELRVTILQTSYS